MHLLYLQAGNCSVCLYGNMTKIKSQTDCKSIMKVIFVLICQEITPYLEFIIIINNIVLA